MKRGFFFPRPWAQPLTLGRFHSQGQENKFLLSTCRRRINGQHCCGWVLCLHGPRCPGLLTKGEKLEELIPDKKVFLLLPVPPSPPCLMKVYLFLCLFLWDTKGSQSFALSVLAPFWRTLLQADPRCSQIPTNLGVPEVGCTWSYISTGLYLIPWLRSSETFLSTPPVPFCSLEKFFPSSTPRASVYPFLEGTMTPFLSIKGCFDPLRQTQWVKSSLSASWKRRLGKEINYSHQG